MADETTNGWSNNKQFVLHELGRLSQAIAELDRKVENKVDKLDRSFYDLSKDLSLENQRNKFRQSVIGVLVVSIPTIIGTIIWYLTHK